MFLVYKNPREGEEAGKGLRHPKLITPTLTAFDLGVWGPKTYILGVPTANTPSS